MLKWLGKIRELFTPRTAVGFMLCGWFGALITLQAMVSFPGFTGFLVVIVIYGPLYYFAARARDKQIRLAGHIKELEAYVHEAMEDLEDDDRADEDNGTA